MTGLSHADRRKIVRARSGSLLLDSALIAYAMWCLDFLCRHFGVGTPFLSRWPLLLLLAPLLALLWQARGSLAQVGYRNRLIQGDKEVPAASDQRLLVALLGGVQLGLVLLPMLLLGLSASSVVASVVLAAGFMFIGLRQPMGRSLAEYLAGARTTLKPIPASEVPPPWHQRLNSWIVLTVLLLTFVVGWIITDVSPGELLTGWPKAKHMVGELTTPDWSITSDVIQSLVETIFFALMASAFALPVAFAFSFLGARNVMSGTALGRFIYFVARFLMNLARSIEPVIWVIIFVLWAGTGPFAGMLALFVHSVAALSKLYSEAIESIDNGPVEALQATGASPLHVLRYGIVPQVIPPFISFTVYRWDINVRMATILGFVGAGGIGKMLIEYTQLGTWPKVGVIIVFITLVVWLMDIASSKARERLV